MLTPHGCLKGGTLPVPILVLPGGGQLTIEAGDSLQGFRGNPVAVVIVLWIEQCHRRMKALRLPVLSENLRLYS